MKRAYVLPLLALPLLLSGCGNSIGIPERDTSLNDLLRNPLYAEHYYDDLTEHMVNLSLHQDPILLVPSIQKTVDRTRSRSLQHATLAKKAQDQGSRGSFLSDRSLVSGEALFLHNILYFGPTFNATPGPSLSVYLTTTIDPRDAAFPDPTAVRVGGVHNHYGAQSYAVAAEKLPTGTGTTLRTVVLFDDELELLYGFAQLSHVLR